MARQFNYNTTLAGLMTPQVVLALGDVHEHRGRQSLYLASKPQVLETLCEVAKVQSTSSSNRIENISTSDERLRALMEKTTEPRNRDEREIAGYRYVLDLIHQQHANIPVTPGVILQLHRDLYRYQDVSFAGRWKDSDNSIVEILDDGTKRTRFTPVSAARTPDAIAAICEQYKLEMERGVFDPLLISLVFAFDFVSIHPFNDGNGRLSRLLTLLLLYKCNYLVGKYVSVEAEIEASKESYYDALQASSTGWLEGTSDYTRFVTYMLGVLTACYRTLDVRYDALTSTESNEQKLRAYFATVVGAVSKRQIMDDNPTISKRTVERVLQRLQNQEVITKVGAARATKYKRR